MVIKVMDIFSFALFIFSNVYYFSVKNQQQKTYRHLLTTNNLKVNSLFIFNVTLHPHQAVYTKDPHKNHIPPERSLQQPDVLNYTSSQIFERKIFHVFQPIY